MNTCISETTVTNFICPFLYSEDLGWTNIINGWSNIVCQLQQSLIIELFKSEEYLH